MNALLADDIHYRQPSTMNLVNFVALLRDHYVDQFHVFAEKQRRSCTKGAAEVKLQLSEKSNLFQELYCADFISNDGQGRIMDLRPETFFTFDPIMCSFGSIALSIEHLHWDDVLIHHNVAVLSTEELTAWFRFWFDPDDERHAEDDEFEGLVHSLLVQPHVLSIDFGTAQPGAFWNMLLLLEEAGATAIRVSSSRAETADAT